MISNFFLFIFFFRFFFINSEYVHYVRVKKFYGFSQNSDSYPLNKANDGYSESFTILKYPFILIADFEDYYVIKEILLYTTANCCGLKKMQIGVSTLSSLDFNDIKNLKNDIKNLKNDIKNLKKHYLCDPLKENQFGIYIELKCYNIPIIIRYLIIHRVYDEDKYDKNKNELMPINEIIVNGYKYVPYVHKFVGCYRKPRVEFNRTYKSFEECASFCSVQKYYFISYTEKYCFCVNSVKDMGLKSHFKFCNVQCKKRSQYLCGGVNDQYFPLYLVCFPPNYSTKCQVHPYFVIVATCPPNTCFSMPGSCNNKGRNCSMYNGGCGTLNCVTETLYGFKYADCFANEGYNLDLNFKLSEIDECEYNISDCNEMETCVNTPGSYKCIQTQEYQFKRLTSLPLLSLLILLVLSVVVYKIATKNQKKEPETIKKTEKTFFRRSEAKPEKKKVKVKRTKTGRRIPERRGFMA